ncbi:hypothetical protein T05_13994 [Trichinella murrelli]|uniref:Uncharacterized protein n=1 Tax=Trichinella murrelli TaxID=144512 RepID=A0A0V0U998_9BILA|nr:hypothetical protein T05_13994 [Trichinella murrelli]
MQIYNIEGRKAFLLRAAAAIFTYYMTTSEDDSLGNFLSVKPKALSFVHRIAIDTETSKQMAEQANGMCSR